jgi:hypothetical protein
MNMASNDLARRHFLGLTSKTPDLTEKARMELPVGLDSRRNDAFRW